MNTNLVRHRAHYADRTRKMHKNYCQLSLDERREIYKYLEAGLSKTEIARRLGRHRSTIFREVQRNSYYDEDRIYNGYFHVNAQEFASRRRNRLRKLLQRSDLRAFVVNRLKLFWSPDQIAGFLKRLAIPGFYVCHETIYAFIYSPEGRLQRLYRYLCRKFMNRRKRHRRTPRHLRGVPERLSICDRPEEVQDRNNFGHWEGDLLIFRREFGNANVTSLVERKSRYTVLLKNPCRKSAIVVGQIKNHLTSLPRASRRSVTFDRGSEFMGWRDLNPHLDLGSFYCDARSPWQKGTNENTNGRVRRFLPGETNINEVSSRDLRLISERLNATPRKCLDYRTPKEVFEEHLHGDAVALAS